MRKLKMNCRQIIVVFTACPQTADLASNSVFYRCPSLDASGGWDGCNETIMV